MEHVGLAPESSLKVTDNYRSLSEGFYPLKREERDLYEQAIQGEGKIWKKSSKMFVGYQKRYFKVLAKGSYLAYYDKKPGSKHESVKPIGVFEIAKMNDIAITQPKYFKYEYNERCFQMYTKTKEEADMWVVCLKFLQAQKNRELETATSSRSASYFHTLTNTLQNNHENNNLRHSDDIEPGSKKKNELLKANAHKFNNIDAKAFGSVINENPSVVVNKDRQPLSIKALTAKGILNYLKGIKASTLNSRLLCGFLRKRSKGKIKYFNNRWYFLISSRPLLKNQEDFLYDSEVLSENMLPPLIEFDVIYYYIMDTSDDTSGPLGEIRTLDILKVEIKNMTKSSEEGHAFIIDTGKKLFHLNTPHRFELEKWVEAIEISMQTSRERQLSITGACRNISRLVTLYETNEDIVRQQIEEKYEQTIPKYKDDWEDVDSLLQVCSELREDLVTTFDACLALSPPRTDIIELYMKVAHSHMSDVLSRFWESNAITINPYETLALVDWTYHYFRLLKKFGVNDDQVENGYLQLCNAYAKKIHTQLTPIVISILKNERENIQIEEDSAGFLFTNAPYDIVRIFSESFQVVVAKKIKDLILKLLKIFQVITQQYQRALSRLLESDNKLQHDFMIAQCNNCFIYFELMEDLLQPVRDFELANEVEIDTYFSQRSVQQYFSKIQAHLLNEITTSIFRLRLQAPYQKSFLELDMESILNESFKYFEDYANKMSQSTARQAWASFLERTVLCYIQCMLNSSNKIRQKSSEHTIVKIKEDYEKIEIRFGGFMTTRLMKSGIEVLDDLVSFFEASPAFISVACEKLRKTHGPTFKLVTVKAILNLRTDMNKEEKAMAFKVCGEILDSFKNEQFNNPKKKGIFYNLDTTQTQAERGSGDLVEKLDQVNADEEGLDIDIDDFLKEGGINTDGLNDAEQKYKSNNKVKEEMKEEIEQNTDPDEKLSGYLIKSSAKIEADQEGEDLIGMMINGIGTGMKIGLKIFTEAMFIKQSKEFFAIKNGILYWYAHERARKAKKHIPIKDAKAIELDKKNPKGFYVVYKQKCYRLQSKHEKVALKWVNSLKMVMQNDPAQMGANRYENQKIFQKITGKSMFKDYELILEDYEDKLHGQIETKINEIFLQKHKGKKVSSPLPPTSATLKKGAKKGLFIENNQKGEEEAFIKTLPETADLMNKINPSQIDLYQAAFGGEDLAYASVIKKKLQEKAIRRAEQKEREERNFNSGYNSRPNSSNIGTSKFAKNNQRIKEEQRDESPEVDLFVRRDLLVKKGHKKKQIQQRFIWESPDQKYSPTSSPERAKEASNQKSKGIMKDDKMQGMSLRTLALDPNELNQSLQPLQSPFEGRPQASCFACFTFGGKNNQGLLQKSLK